ALSVSTHAARTDTHQAARDGSRLLAPQASGSCPAVLLAVRRGSRLLPRGGEQRCTAAMLLEIDPIGLVRRGVRFSLLDQYVNDRPYAASSFMSVALGELLRATANLAVDTTDPESERAATRTELTESGGEGMVVKPLEFIARGRRG